MHLDNEKSQVICWFDTALGLLRKKKEREMNKMNTDFNVILVKLEVAINVDAFVQHI